MTLDPGLDINSLQALRGNNRHKLPVLRQRIRRHLDNHDGYLAWSGGKDSTVVLHLALQVEPNLPVVFFDGGAEFPETYSYLSQLADEWNIDLHFFRSSISVFEIMKIEGFWDFNSPTRHITTDAKKILINDPADRAHDEFGPGELWGVRSAESHGRRMHFGRALNQQTCRMECCDSREQARREHGGVLERVNGQVTFSPIWDWSDPQVYAYLEQYNVPLNPIYDKLRRLGAPPSMQRVASMISGQWLDSGKMVWLRRGWPALYNDLLRHFPRMQEWV